MHKDAIVDCRSTGQAIDPAAGVCFIHKQSSRSLAQVVTNPVQPYRAEILPISSSINSLFLYSWLQA